MNTLLVYLKKYDKCWLNSPLYLIVSVVTLTVKVRVMPAFVVASQSTD